MVRALLLDYRNAFDLIDHHILMNKLRHLIGAAMVCGVLSVCFLARTAAEGTS